MHVTPGKRWRHVIFNTHNSWLHGDTRGFRNRNNRIHSSGDYRNPPSRFEHSGLRDYHEQRSGTIFRFSKKALEPIGLAIVESLKKGSHGLAALSVNPTHVHLLSELPDNVDDIKKIVGWCKFFATRAARNVEPRLKDVELWAQGETYKPVDDPAHFAQTKRYITTRQGTDAWAHASDFVR